MTIEPTDPDFADLYVQASASADRFAKELADMRILLDHVKNERDEALTEAWEHEKHIDHLRDGLREISYLTGDAAIRELAESYLRDDDPPA